MPDATKSREIHLVARPHGEPTLDNFELVTVAVPASGPGEVLVRNRYMSVDPYMRGRMNDVKSYVHPFALGEVLQGGAVGEVVESASPDLAVGDTVVHNLGWRDYAVVPADQAAVVDADAAPISHYLGILGMPGFTAWIGLTEIAALAAGDRVFVSGAAGAVGSAAGQMARLLGASSVVGSAGTDAKVTLLTGELGFDAAFNYKAGPVADQLVVAAPKGIDVYFDNVGGDHLEAAIASMRNFGRIAACGSISGYNATEAPVGPRNMSSVVAKRITMRGFIVSDHVAQRPAFVAQVGGWLADGSLQAPETVVDGLAHAPDAFIGLLRGENTGKILVRVED